MRRAALDPLSRDPDPMRVVQGPEFTWVVEEDGQFSVPDAIMILHRNVPVRPGPGDVVLRGWSPARLAEYDTFDLSLTPGFWLLPNLPHSWAPFGFGNRALPIVAPRLRDALNPLLDSLGLVGRAVIEVEFSSTDAGNQDPGRRQRYGFQVANLERTELGILEDRLEREPGAVRSAVGEADDAAALAAALFTESQRRAFLEFVPEADRTRFLQEMERYCLAR